MARKEVERDYYEEEPRQKNPLKGFVIALVVLLILFAVIIVLLFSRVQNANEKVEKLNSTLQETQTELYNTKAELAAIPTPSPTPEPTEVPTPTPVPTPEPTEEPTATPEATATPEPTPVPLLKDTITDEMLNGCVRPADNEWFDEMKSGVIRTGYAPKVKWGPAYEYFDNMTISAGMPVDYFAESNGWTLIRNAEGKFGWCGSDAIIEGDGMTGQPDVNPQTGTTGKTGTTTGGAPASNPNLKG